MKALLFSSFTSYTENDKVIYVFICFEIIAFESLSFKISNLKSVSDLHNYCDHPNIQI